VFIEANDDGDGGYNWNTGAVSRAKLQSNHHHQQTNIQFFTGRMSFLSPNQQCQSTDLDLIWPLKIGVAVPQPCSVKITRRTVHCLEIQIGTTVLRRWAWINIGSGKDSSSWVRPSATVHQDTQPHTHTHKTTYTRTYIHPHTPTYTHTHTYTHPHTPTYTHPHLHTHTST